MVHPAWLLLIVPIEAAVIFGLVWMFRSWQAREDRRRANEERLYNAAEEAVREMTK